MDSYTEEDGTFRYKEVISWIGKFDGTATGYKGFASDCDTCFKKIEKKSYASLLMYVKTLLDKNRFAFLLGTDIRTWEDLRKLLDEHFGIRKNEKALFRNLTSMKKEEGDDLFTFYNKLLQACHEYKLFLYDTLDDKATVQLRVKQAEEYILDSFIMSVGSNFRAIIRDKNPSNIVEAYRILVSLEESTGTKSSDQLEDKLNEVLKLLKISKDPVSFTKPTIRRVEESDKGATQIVCQFCDRVGHLAKNCYRIPKQNNGNGNPKEFSKKNTNNKNNNYNRNGNNKGNWRNKTFQNKNNWQQQQQQHQQVPNWNCQYYVTEPMNAPNGFVVRGGNPSNYHSYPNQNRQNHQGNAVVMAVAPESKYPMIKDRNSTVDD